MKRTGTGTGCMDADTLVRVYRVHRTFLTVLKT